GSVKPADIIGKEVTSFAEDSKGDVWMSSGGIGLIKLDAKTNELNYIEKIKDEFISSKVTSLVFDDLDNLWISTGEGLYRLDTNNFSIKKYNLISKGFGDDKPSVLFQNKKGVIWAGTYGSGLFYFNKETDEFVNLYENQKPN